MFQHFPDRNFLTGGVLIFWIELAEIHENLKYLFVSSVFFKNKCLVMPCCSRGIIRGGCKKKGVSLDAVTPAEMDAFALLVMADLAGILSASEAKVSAAILR